jgi:hypothetical protein
MSTATLSGARLSSGTAPAPAAQAGARPSRRHRLLRFVQARPFLASLLLSLLYFGALTAFVATLATSSMDALVGILAVAVYASIVVLTIGIGVFTVLPERRTDAA